ncbi:oxysterol-binding protein-related protein [Acrasis kona]|uniref:Oxysterol-binding protein-related protein n=1 Tax=Acrasis kona TaxID=1008807 RepID=A0AAW2YZE5_9EUKA
MSDSDTSASEHTHDTENLEDIDKYLEENGDDSNVEEAKPIVVENIYEDDQKYNEQEFIYDENDPRTRELEALEGEALSRAKIIMDVVKQLRTGKDLYRISLPSALLAPVSMLEYISNFLVPHSFISRVSKQLEPEQRFTSVLKWWVSNLVGTPRPGIMHCKPYNAVHGEVFAAKFISDDSKTYYISEQVSHHPPVSAVYMWNPQKNFSIVGTLKPKSKFHGNSASNVIEGDITFRIHNLDEEYNIVFPYVVGKGLLWGNQCIEISEQLKITCAKTKFSGTVDFKSKNAVKGSIKKDGKRIYKIHGDLQNKLLIKNASNKKETEFLNAVDVPKLYKYVRPVSTQREFESRKVWHRVTHSIKHKNFDAANVRKVSVEEVQRNLRSERKERNEELQSKYFIQSGDSWKFKFEHPGPYQSGDEKALEQNVDLFATQDHELESIKKNVPDFEE